MGDAWMDDKATSSSALAPALPALPASPLLPALPSELEVSLTRRAEEKLELQSRKLVELVDNLNEGVYRSGRAMLWDEDLERLNHGLEALGKLQLRVRKGFTTLQKIDAERDQLDFGELEEFPRAKHTLRQQRRVINKVTERLTEQVERDANVLDAFRELIGRMGTRLNYATITEDALREIREADAAQEQEERRVAVASPAPRPSSWWH